jgi:ubiquinone/menaquinone biosynthesis C-methylase UbiE
VSGAPVREWREFYEYEADVYQINAEDEPAFRHRRTLVRRLLPEAQPTRVLDVGCGDGALARDLAERTGGRVIGVDLSFKRVGRAAGTLPLAQASAYALPFESRAFDLVVCTDLLEHLDEPERAMAELVRVSSAHVLVTVPYSIQIEKTLCPHCGKDYFLYGHQHSFGKPGVQRLAERSGARVQRFEHVIPMFECRRYKWFPPLKWLIWDHFKNSGTLGALIERA